MKTLKLVKIDTQEHEQAPGYILHNEDHYALACLAPRNRGECLCLMMVVKDGRSDYKQCFEDNSYINLTAAELKKMAKNIEWVAAQHLKNKPLTKPVSKPVKINWQLFSDSSHCEDALAEFAIGDIETFKEFESWFLPVMKKHAKEIRKMKNSGHGIKYWRRAAGRAFKRMRTIT